MSDKGREPVVWIVYNDGVRDFSLAKKFGKLRSIVSGNYRGGFLKNSARMIEYIRETLSTYSCGDYILMVGEPALCGLAITIAREMSEESNVNILRWDNHALGYQPLRLELSPLKPVSTEVGKETQTDFNIK